MEGQLVSNFPVRVLLFIPMRATLVPGELLRVATVSFVTSLGPLTRQAVVQPGASFRRSIFAFLAFLKHYLVAQFNGLLITVIFHLSFAPVA